MRILTSISTVSRVYNKMDILVIKNLLMFALLKGTFLKDIKDNATWNYYFKKSNGMGEEEESRGLPFCDAIENIEQPDANRTRECPPEEVFAMISVHTWVPWILGQVSPSSGEY